MANTFVRLSSLLLVGLICLSWASADQLNDFEDKYYGSVSWERFSRSGIANRKIDLSNPDMEILNAAVFFASNKARAKQKLALLRFDPSLRNMARFHAQQMARFHFVSHDNPRSPRYATVEARGRQFNAQVNAENVASTFLHRYRSGSRYYAKPSPQGYVFFDASHQEIKLHTYWSFAEDIVQGWIDSPSHRRNLFHVQLKTLGCACEIGKGEIGSGELPMAYCGQNFGIGRNN
ncbi:MAG: CAP domain-containing protein [Bacteroidota bacterium]